MTEEIKLSLTKEEVLLLSVLIYRGAREHSEETKGSARSIMKKMLKAYEANKEALEA